MDDRVPRVVIVGGGFGGLGAAKALGKTQARVLLIDRTNHHLFQPLLYQVATAVLAPGQIASPIREILRRQLNTTVILGEVTGVDVNRQSVLVNSADREEVPIPYDYLVLATGAGPSYFGHDEYEKVAPGLKSLADAVAARNKILRAFEQAEAEEDPSRHRDLLTFVLVGAGPTGVEMAGALAGLVRSTLRSEYRRIDPSAARVILVDMGNRVLGAFADALSRAAKERLEKLGVEVRLGHGVDQIDAEGVTVAGERIASKTVICTVAGHPEIFVIGDTASLDQDGKPLAGVAQVAMQQGRYVGRLIHRRVTGQSAPGPFRYFDKGNMAVVGKGFAVLQSGRVHVSGLLAWLAWAAVHLEFVGQSSLRISVFLQWVWTYLTGQRGSRLIVDYHASGNDDARTRSAPERQLAGTR